MVGNLVPLFTALSRERSPLSDEYSNSEQLSRNITAEMKGAHSAFLQFARILSAGTPKAFRFASCSCGGL